MGDQRNLRHFQPGQSGNPSGRRSTRHLTALLADVLARPDGKRDRRRDERLVERLVQIALTGRRSEALRAMALILAYVDGLPVARVEAGEPGDFAEGFEIRLVHVTEPTPLDG